MAQHGGVGLELYSNLHSVGVAGAGSKVPRAVPEGSTLVLPPLLLRCPAMPYAFSVFQFLQL